MQEKRLKHYPFWVYVLLFLVSQLVAMAMPLLLLYLPAGQALSQNAVLAVTLLVANLLAIVLFFCFRPRCLTLASTLSGD